MDAVRRGAKAVAETGGKRYYWLKLQDDFFKSKRIKKLRKIAGGDTYTIIYLKMQLLAMKNGGVLEYTGLEPSFAEELALDLDEEAENVGVTINFLLSCGLLETSDNREYFVPYAVLNTGSEGASAKRVREHRERKALQCNAAVTPTKQDGNGEKEKIEDTEKILETREDINNSIFLSSENESFENGENVEKLVENPEAKRELLGGLGEGLVFLSNEQMEDLLTLLSVDEFNHYVSVVAKCEQKGMHFAKPHYQAIIEMATADRKMKR